MADPVKVQKITLASNDGTTVVVGKSPLATHHLAPHHPPLTKF